MSTLTPHDSQSIHTTRSVASSARTHRLIKRVIASNDLKPSDLLIERFQIWKSVCNSLIVLFKGECMTITVHLDFIPSAVIVKA